MRIGIYNRWLPTLGGGERHSLAIAASLQKNHEITAISHSEMVASAVAERLQLDLSQVRFVCLPELSRAHMAAHSAEYDLFIHAAHGVYFPNRARHGALLVFFPSRIPTGIRARLRSWAAQTVQDWLTPRIIRLLSSGVFSDFAMRLQYPVPLDLQTQLDSYDQVWANSKFTQLWIETYWRRESLLLYPQVAVDQFTARAKRNRILSVGRFFRGHHNKKHEVMVRAFQELARDGLADWELHLAGGTLPDPVHQSYVADIRNMSQGAPVYLHTDIASERLRDLYATSAIYWHAAGYGEDEDAAPERLEHFGMSTVEAMAAECAPVVLGRGGQIELIDHGVDGFLWYTTDQLKAYTLRLVQDPEQRKRMGNAARNRSRQFDEAAFERRLHSALIAMGLEP